MVRVNQGIVAYVWLYLMVELNAIGGNMVMQKTTNKLVE